MKKDDMNERAQRWFGISEEQRKENPSSDEEAWAVIQDLAEELDLYYLEDQMEAVDMIQGLENSDTKVGNAFMKALKNAFTEAAREVDDQVGEDIDDYVEERKTRRLKWRW